MVVPETHIVETPFKRTIPPGILDDLSSRFIINVPENERKDLIRICFQVELAHWFYLDFYCKGPNGVKKSCGIKEFAVHIFNHIPFLKPYVSNVGDIIEDWRGYKSSVPTYGAILLNEDLSHVLLVQSYCGRSSWGFPKGKVNKNEVPYHCAIREVYEETGFNISDLIDPSEFIEASVNDQVVRLYIVTGISKSVVFKPRTRNEIKAVSWFPLNDLPSSKKDASSKLKISPCSFFMVAPFLRRLRQWIFEHSHDKKKITHRTRNKSCGDIAGLSFGPSGCILAAESKLEVNNGHVLNHAMTKLKTDGVKLSGLDLCVGMKEKALMKNPNKTLFDESYYAMKTDSLINYIKTSSQLQPNICDGYNNIFSGLGLSGRSLEAIEENKVLSKTSDKSENHYSSDSHSGYESPSMPKTYQKPMLDSHEVEKELIEGSKRAHFFLDEPQNEDNKFTTNCFLVENGPLTNKFKPAPPSAFRSIGAIPSTNKLVPRKQPLPSKVTTDGRAGRRVSQDDSSSPQTLDSPTDPPKDTLSMGDSFSAKKKNRRNRGRRQRKIAQKKTPDPLPTYSILKRSSQPSMPKNEKSVNLNLSEESLSEEGSRSPPLPRILPSSQPLSYEFNCKFKVPHWSNFKFDMDRILKSIESPTLVS